MEKGKEVIIYNWNEEKMEVRILKIQSILMLTFLNFLMKLFLYIKVYETIYKIIMLF